MVIMSVIWTQTAITQRCKILKYWTTRNKSTIYAEKLIVLIKPRIDLITKNPELGKPTNHSETRVVAMGNFSIYNKSLNHKIFITSFWDNPQDPD